MLASYRRPSSPAIAEHLLDKQPEQQSAHCLPSLCRPKSDDDGQAAAMVTVDWACVLRTCKAWLKNPMNIALLLWLLCVGVSGGMLLLLLLGLLFPAASMRNGWMETNNQVLNALFTLMSLYQHPALCHHLFLLCRWRLELRAAYCKQPGSTTRRRGERLHMGVVVALLHLTVGCQYVLCGLYWGYTKATRPELLEDGFFVLGVAAPVAAAAYTACSPLGGKSDQAPDLFLVSSDATAIEEENPMMDVVVVEPEWAGGMFDLAGDPAAAALSTSCTFCVFGWNAERLGFGNRYVHAATFALLCFAPLWVLGVSALHIGDYVVGDAVGGAGVVLCACGLLYGGYWRIQMRRKFGLPGSAACCGSKSLTDYARWLFCWPCALAQEVRTASRYHVAGETFYYSKSSKVVVVHGDDGHEEETHQPLLKCSTNHDVSCAPVDTTVVAAVPPTNDHQSGGYFLLYSSSLPVAHFLSTIVVFSHVDGSASVRFYDTG
ncbi:hypothetical protein EJB05_03029, partial [Eragrostis curvula]